MSGGREELHDAGEMINASEARARTTVSEPVDLMFERLEEKDPGILQSSSTKIQTCGGQDRKKHTYLMRREVSPIRH